MTENKSESEKEKPGAEIPPESGFVPADEDGKIRILVVIPLYNHAKTIREIAEKTIASGLPVLVIDDGSDDEGAKNLHGLECTLIWHSMNEGKGAAILSAAAWAESHDFTHMITIDADGQHDPAEINKFVEKIHDNPLSIVVGNRDFSQTDVPFASRFGRANSNFWLQVATGVKLPDTQSGFRAYPVEVIQDIPCKARRYSYEAEILARAAWAGVELASVDISVVYSEETRKASHFDKKEDNWRYTKTYTRLVLRNFLPWPHKILYGETHGQKFKAFLINPWRFIKQLFIEKLSPWEVTSACMLGIFLGTLPLIACHCAAIIFASTRLRLNRMVALNISHLCAPPFVPAICIEIGFFVRNGHFLTEFNLQTLGAQIGDRILDYLLGSVIMAPALALLIGIIVYPLVSAIYLVINFRKSHEPA